MCQKRINLFLQHGPSFIDLGQSLHIQQLQMRRMMS